MNGCVILEGVSHRVVIVSVGYLYCFDHQSFEPALAIEVDRGLRL
nr:hypothetical protein [uncultured bacterium]